MSSRVIVAVVIMLGLAAPAAAAPSAEQARRLYRWQRHAPGYRPLSSALPAPPVGSALVKEAGAGYGYFLHHLPLYPPSRAVRSYRDQPILPANHRHVFAVVDLDLGLRDRQQCADSIMRLYGEYLFASDAADSAAFFWAGGRRFNYADWRRGLRPVRIDPRRHRYRFAKRAAVESGYRSFRRYLSYMFAWTGTLHMVSEPKVSDPLPGDFFVQAGSPGHAVLILAVAKFADGRRALVLGQGFIPAQDFHVLRTAGGSPWFVVSPGQPVKTPFWRAFSWSELRRFGSAGRRRVAR